MSLNRPFDWKVLIKILNDLKCIFKDLKWHEIHCFNIHFPAKPSKWNILNSPLFCNMCACMRVCLCVCVCVCVCVKLIRLYADILIFPFSYLISQVPVLDQNIQKTKFFLILFVIYSLVFVKVCLQYLVWILLWYFQNTYLVSI